jgi:hypothetical protein
VGRQLEKRKRKEGKEKKKKKKGEKERREYKRVPITLFPSAIATLANGIRKSVLHSSSCYCINAMSEFRKRFVLVLLDALFILHCLHYEHAFAHCVLLTLSSVVLLDRAHPFADHALPE